MRGSGGRELTRRPTLLIGTTPPPPTRSIEVLRQAGFRVVAASWYTPENIHHLSQAALTAGAEGLLQTTWMGYFPDERAMRGELRQFTAFVLAAEYAWSGRNESPSQLGYDPKDVFRKAYAGSR